MDGHLKSGWCPLPLVANVQKNEFMAVEQPGEAFPAQVIRHGATRRQHLPLCFPPFEQKVFLLCEVHICYFGMGTNPFCLGFGS